MTSLANIPVTCLSCSAHFRTRPGNAGKRGSCPSCGAPVRVMSQAPKEEHHEAPPPPRALRFARIGPAGQANKAGSDQAASHRLFYALGLGLLAALLLGWLFG